MVRFDDSFDSTAYPEDTLHTVINGFDIEARIEHDHDCRIDDDDVHNPDQSVTGCDDEQQQQLLDARAAYFRNEWSYCGVVLSVSKNSVKVSDNAASLWGLELNYPGSDNSYLTEVANELLPEAVECAEKEVKEMVAKLLGNA